MDLRERRAGHGRHPWEVARARFFRRLLADHVDLGTVAAVLDAGAGDGWFAGELAADVAAGAEIVCWDVNYRSEDLAAPDGAGVRRTASRPAGPFDVVLLLDVLEHLDDADSFLADAIVPLLAPDATAVVSVPAHPWLYSAHDRMLEHRRRYRRRELLDVVGRHLTVVEHGALFTTLLAPRAVAVAGERSGFARRPTGVGGWRHGPVVTRALTAVLDADAAAGRLAARARIPVPGLSVWAVARRRVDAP